VEVEARERRSQKVEEARLSAADGRRAETHPLLDRAAPPPPLPPPPPPLPPPPWMAAAEPSRSTAASASSTP